MRFRLHAPKLERVVRHWSIGLMCLLFAEGLARADIATTWDGATSTWTNATHWSGGVFPNNAGSVFYDATINGGAVSLDQGITINQLSIAGGALDGTSALAALEGLQWSAGAIRGGFGATFNNLVEATFTAIVLVPASVSAPLPRMAPALHCNPSSAASAEVPSSAPPASES